MRRATSRVEDMAMGEAMVRLKLFRLTFNLNTMVSFKLFKQEIL